MSHERADGRTGLKVLRPGETGRGGEGEEEAEPDFGEYQPGGQRLGPVGEGGPGEEGEEVGDGPEEEQGRDRCDGGCECVEGGGLCL